MQLLLTKKVNFGADVAVLVHPDAAGEITIPSLEEGKVERREASAHTVGLRLLKHPNSALFSVCPAHRRGTVKVCDDGKLSCHGFISRLDHVAKRSESSGLTLCWLRLSARTSSRAREQRGPAAAGGERPRASR